MGVTDKQSAGKAIYLPPELTVKHVAAERSVATFINPNHAGAEWIPDDFSEQYNGEI